MSRKNAIMKRIISLSLCIALLMTMVNYNGLFKQDITAIEETSSSTEIKEFTDYIFFRVSSYSSINLKLPSTLNVIFNDDSTGVVDVKEWKEHSSQPSISAIITYYFEPVIADSYTVASEIQLPIASIAVDVTSGKDFISNKGKDSVDFSALESHDICDNCFGKINVDGTCATCGQSELECTCEEQDVDLTNKASVEAWIAKYSPYKVEQDTSFYGDILFYEDEWWDNLKPNAKILAENIYSYIAYGYYPYNYSNIFLDHNVSEVLFFMQHNRSEVSFSQIFRGTPYEYLNISMLKQIVEIDPEYNAMTLIGLTAYYPSYQDGNYDLNKISKLYPEIYDYSEEFMDAIYNVSKQLFSNFTLLNGHSNTSFRYSTISQFRTYQVTKTAVSSKINIRNTNGTDWGFATADNAGFNPELFGVDNLYISDAAEFPVVFCGNHGADFKAGEYTLSGIVTDKGEVGACIEYAQMVSDYHINCQLQQVIWALIGDISEKDTCNSESKLYDRNSVKSNPKYMQLVKMFFAGKGNPSSIDPAYPSFQIEEHHRDYYIWTITNGTTVCQPIYSITAPIEVEETPSKASPVGEVFRTRITVRHNLSKSINSENGTNVIGSWNPDTFKSANAQVALLWGSTSESAMKYTLSDCETEWIETTEKLRAEDYGYYTNMDTGDVLTTTPTKSDSDFADVKNEWAKRHLEVETVKAPYWDSNPPEPYTSTRVGNLITVTYHTRNKTVKYKTFKNYFWTSGTHNFDAPKVENYSMTLHFQGGYCEDEYPTVEGTMKNKKEGTYPATYASTRNNKQAKEVWTKETTNVKFTRMVLKANYELNTSKTTTRKAYTTVINTGDKLSITHKSDMDGIHSQFQFQYKNYYIVTLPTPSRVGYNFMGWYTERDGGTQVEPEDKIVIKPSNVSSDVYGSVSKQEYENSYVITKDTELYARWELITKDEKFTVNWLDNNNNYNTRPTAIYVELWRYTSSSDAEQCEQYITELWNKSTSRDWVFRYSNETGMSYKGLTYALDGYKVGVKSNGSYDATNKMTYDPNVVDKNGTTIANNIFETANGNYFIKIDPTQLNNTGDYKNPSTKNEWTFTLKDLQKFDTTQPDWKEYTYVVKEVTVDSLDETTKYYVSSTKTDNDYTKPLSNYNNIKDNSTNPSGQKNRTAYDNLDMKTKFNSKTIVNRLANVTTSRVLGLGSWKDVAVRIEYTDGEDKYHLRPYAVKVLLYQNYANWKDTSEDNYLDSTGVRVLYKTMNVTWNTAYAYSSTSMFAGIGTTDGKKVLRVIFKNVPTVEDSTCIKIAYDAIITFGQSRYRYTIDENDSYNNLGTEIKKYGSSHYYEIKHQTSIQSINDLSYVSMENAEGLKLTVVPTIWKACTFSQSQYDALSAADKRLYQYEYVKNSDGNYTSTKQWYTIQTSGIKTGRTIYQAEVLRYTTPSYGSYYFLNDNYNNIYQATSNGGLLTADSDNTLKVNVPGQSVSYNNNQLGYRSPNNSNNVYLQPYKSMAYNLRYYYITEDNYMRAVINYFPGDNDFPQKNQIENMKFKETLYWTFNLTLNGNQYTPIPGEYIGSNSADDRTGNYTESGSATSDDYTHTNNKLVITSKINNQSGVQISDEATEYKKLQISQNQEGFLITLKQMNKAWSNNGDSVTQNYSPTAYSTNGYITYTYDTNRNAMIRSFISGATPITGSTAVGNEYNIYVPASGSTAMNYLPDGKYELSCHYDIDFSNFEFANAGEGLATITSENGKYYLTFSSTNVTDNQSVTHKSKVDYWRGYVDDMNNFDWSRYVRDNNFNIINRTTSGSSNIYSDETKYPFGVDDLKNTLIFNTSTIKAKNEIGYIVLENRTALRYVSTCPIHRTSLAAGKCSEEGCAYITYVYSENDDKNPYTSYTSYKGSNPVGTLK